MTDATITIPQFEGPFRLLLEMIEDEKLAITDIALAKVSQQYLAFVETLEEVPMVELADFLYVASRLLFLKSKLLIPDQTFDDEGEEGVPLAQRLRMYQMFAERTGFVASAFQNNRRAFFGTLKRPQLPAGFYPPSKTTTDSLRDAMRGLLLRLEPLLSLPQVRLQKVVSIHEKIAHIKEKIAQSGRIHFGEVTDLNNKFDTIVGFLALLELVKTRDAHVAQEHLFEDIYIARYD